jgi:hypothetical protein
LGDRLYHAPLWAGSCCIVSSNSDLSKHVEAVNSWSIRHGTVYFWNRAAASHSHSRSSFHSNKQEKPSVKTIVQEIYWKPLFIFSNASVRTSSYTSITLLTDWGWDGEGSATRW